MTSWLQREQGGTCQLTVRAGNPPWALATKPEYRKFPGRLPAYKPPAKLLINNKLEF